MDNEAETDTGAQIENGVEIEWDIERDTQTGLGTEVDLANVGVFFGNRALNSFRLSIVPNDTTDKRPELLRFNSRDDTKLPAKERVQQLLAEVDYAHVPHDLFCQMDLLRPFQDDLVWREMARWVKYEEAVEEGGDRWSKPHVASLPMESLCELKAIIKTCPILFDYDCHAMPEVVDAVLECWGRDQMFSPLLRNHLRAILLKKHKYQQPGSKAYKEDARENGFLNESYLQNEMEELEETLETLTTRRASHALSFSAKPNIRFMRHIPEGSEVVNMMVGELRELDKRIASFIRLKEPRKLGGITEVKLPTRFLFILLGPQGDLEKCAQITRCIGALFTDEIFRTVAYKSKSRKDILAGIKEFSYYTTVLPPGSWDPSTRIEPPDLPPLQEHRKKIEDASTKLQLLEADQRISTEPHCDPTLQRTGRLFGGLIDDIKRKAKWYLSDFKDCLHLQCIASFFYLFLATLTPNVTFGGLLGQATDQYMGTMECILSGAICGVLFALFSGQPINILGSTGPMLILEGIIYNLCIDNKWEFLPLRFWIGMWTTFFLLLVVAFDLSALVRYITRFTEESFACLIALIFIYEAFKKAFHIEELAPVQFHPDDKATSECFCLVNETNVPFGTFPEDGSSNATYHGDWIPVIKGKDFQNDFIGLIGRMNCSNFTGELIGDGCDDHKYVPDVFFFSLILFVGTFTLAMTFVNFRHSLFFPAFVRQTVSDFAVLIAIIAMVLCDALLGLPTPKLLVPTEFKPTRSDRDWTFNPISDRNPWWTILLAGVPAILATILVFMDQQITAVIVNRKQNKLKKGSGYHLDLLIVAILVAVLSLLGLPWYVAATVTALAHVHSLGKQSECTAPGEKPVFLGVREQRVTALLVGIFSGLAVFITKLLQYIPMPVLYGVFLYMGVAALKGMQLVQRVLLVLMPAKYQPDHAYLQHVPIRRVHLFTFVQIICLALLWVVKSIKEIAIAFPVMVAATCFIRKGLDAVFTQRELYWLDDILPPIRGKKKIESADDYESKKHDPEKTLATKLQNNHKQTTERSVSEPHGEKDMVLKHREQRYSCPFVVRTDLDAVSQLSKAEHDRERLSRKTSSNSATSAVSGDSSIKDESEVQVPFQQTMSPTRNRKISGSVSVPPNQSTVFEVTEEDENSPL